MFAPGVPQLMQEFNSTNKELASFVVSVYILGFAIGPMIIAPMSELYGRKKLYQCCNVSTPPTKNSLRLSSQSISSVSLLGP